MKDITFNAIQDAYQLVQGAKIKGKKHEEIFELGAYDANKRGYTVYPFENGTAYTDFAMIMAEKELMTHYLIEVIRISKAA